MTTDSPVLSFPAVLRNPGLVSRFAQIQAVANEHEYVAHTTQIGPEPFRRGPHEGKRWVRRKDNAEFFGNPHIVAAAKHDYAIQPPHILSTFPEPLPPYLPRTVKIPAAQIPSQDPLSANAGRFSLSLKGMRRTLRRSGNRAQILVRHIEQEMVDWLWEGGTLLSPDSAPTGDADVRDLVCRAKCVGELATVLELLRTPLQLVWYVEDDAFARYVVHCCARYHEIVSYSKEVAGFRLTYLLRPNVTRPDHRAPAALDTPPVTDIDYSSHQDSETDVLSDISERGSNFSLSAIGEDAPVPRSPAGSEVGIPQCEEDISGAADIDDSASESNHVLVKVPSLSVDSVTDSGTENSGRGGLESGLQTTPQGPSVQYGQSILARRRTWARSISSPSRSPVRTVVYPRTTARRRYEAPTSTAIALGATKSQMFYDYLYSKT
ncbi:hypothetical protein APHAL10511_000189 [Amanita phalloides]|nr:hypothetical protein APHAL10511_000189 [Amanita phalloides]